MAVLVITAFASFAIRVIDKVRSGHGLDYYFTGEGVRFNYVGALILLVIIPIALLIGWGIRYWSLRGERDFKKRHRIKD